MKTSNAMVTRQVELKLARIRKRLLVELANLRQDGITRFRRVIGVATRFPYEQDASLINYRDELRKAWLAEPAEKQEFVDRLLHDSVIKYGTAVFIAPITAGRLTAAPQHFLSQLAVAVIENWQHFAKCGNPECEMPYFLAKRSTQKYCERGACTAYAQRRYSLDSWYRKRAEAK